MARNRTIGGVALATVLAGIALYLHHDSQTKSSDSVASQPKHEVSQPTIDDRLDYSKAHPSTEQLFAYHYKIDTENIAPGLMDYLASLAVSGHSVEIKKPHIKKEDKNETKTYEISIDGTIGTLTVNTFNPPIVTDEYTKFDSTARKLVQQVTYVGHILGFDRNQRLYTVNLANGKSNTWIQNSVDVGRKALSIGSYEYAQSASSYML